MRHSTGQEVYGAVVGPMRRQGGSLCLAKHLPKVVIFGEHLRRVGGQAGAGRRQRCSSMSEADLMTRGTPALDGAHCPVSVGVMAMETGVAKWEVR